MANKEYIERLQVIIHQLHKCRSTHVTSVYVKNEFQKTVWEGDVEVFSVFGHPDAKWCYGWSYGETGEEFITILELPPVDSPQSAVKVGMARQVNQERKGKA